jgi:uncharacterized membrane protein YphA (DoxX/SURF4 family)
MENTKIPVKYESSYSEHAYMLLKIAFVFAPILAGADKFFNILTQWTDYLAPVFPQMLNVSPETFMYGVGIVEIVAGIGVLLKPKIFAYVVSAWMVGIIINLFVLGSYYDVALRDLGLSIGAFALGQLAVPHEHRVDEHFHEWKWNKTFKDAH